MKGIFLKKPKQPCKESEKAQNSLNIGGIQAFSTQDYPSHLSVVIFCQGCVWRCRYCYNTHLQPILARPSSKHAWKEVMRFLESRQGLVEGVVFSGGEPILQRALVQAIHDVKAMGYKVGLHTGGAIVRRFKEVLPYLDWVGLDIKASISRYANITGVRNSGKYAWESVNALLTSQVAYECRTTVHPMLHSRHDIWEIAQTLHHMGVRHYAIQYFQDQGCIDEELIQTKPALCLDAQFCDKLRRLFDNFVIR